MVNNRFGTALNCIDGRTQLPETEWIKAHYQLDYVDLITEPGMDPVLSHDSPGEIARLREITIVSLTAHSSQVMALLATWGLPVHVIGLWVDEYDAFRLSAPNEKDRSIFGDGPFTYDVCYSKESIIVGSNLKSPLTLFV